MEFKDGDKLQLEKPASGNVVKVELRAENKDKVVSYERLEFTFEDTYQVKKGTTVYFQKPAEWKDKIFIYVYNTKLKENDAWPGEVMKKEADGKYSYTFDIDWDTPLIIFNDGEESDSVQFPADKGLTVEADKTYTVNTTEG